MRFFKMNTSQPVPPSISANSLESSAIPRRSPLARLVVLAISLLLYGVACAAPALVFLGNGGSEAWPGYRVLFLGWLGALIGQFAWYANPLFFFGIITFLFRKWIATIVLIGLTLLMAANTFLLFIQEVPADEAGVNVLTLETLHVGFYLWVASILTIGIGVVILWRIEARETRS
jgi:hypothetical protein